MSRPTVLVLHDDGDALDGLTRLFESSGFDVVTAVTAFRAQTFLESDRRIDLVVAPWDTRHPLGGEIYRWVLPRRYDLRDRFVFLGAEVPEEFDRQVAGRCLLIPMTRPAELVRIALASVRRRTKVEAQTPEPASDLDFDETTHIRLLTQPRLLLAEDEPVLLLVIAEYLEQAGYTVTRVESGHAAIVLLSHDEFDAIVLDWEMDDGSGADVYQWIRGNRPSFGERVVFLSSGDAADADDVAPGRPFFRKGQDAHALTAVLQEIVRQARVDPGA